MARYNAMKEQYEEIEVLGKSALFSNIRIDRSSVPKGLYLYEIRHDDDNFGNPAQIARGILVNHMGSIITNEPIKLPPDGYLDIDPEKDWNYLGGNWTVKEFMEKYPPAKKKNRDMER
jgi:hypothetical protein